MKLFDKFNKKETNKINAQGWDAITKECERIYPNQTNPKHYETLIN